MRAHAAIELVLVDIGLDLRRQIEDLMAQGLAADLDSAATRAMRWWQAVLHGIDLVDAQEFPEVPLVPGLRAAPCPAPWAAPARAFPSCEQALGVWAVDGL